MKEGYAVAYVVDTALQVDSINGAVIGIFH